MIKSENIILVNKLNINESCYGISPCNDHIGLNCLNGICDCLSNQYFNGSVCSNFIELKANYQIKIKN